MIDVLRSFKFVMRQAAVGGGSLRSQRRHEMEAPNGLFASRTVVALAVPAPSKAWLSFFR